jgi:hypothetical protein
MERARTWMKKTRRKKEEKEKRMARTRTEPVRVGSVVTALSPE